MLGMRVVAAEIFIRFSLIEIVWLGYEKGGLRHDAGGYRTASSGAADWNRSGSDRHLSTLHMETGHGSVQSMMPDKVSPLRTATFTVRVSTDSIFVVNPVEPSHWLTMRKRGRSSCLVRRVGRRP